MAINKEVIHLAGAISFALSSLLDLNIDNLVHPHFMYSPVFTDMKYSR